MGTDGAGPSVRAWSLYALTWNVAVWGGWSMVAVAAWKVQVVMPHMPASFWVIAALVLLGELRPVRTAGFFDPQGIVTSTAFVFAIMYLWGLWPAILLQAVATTASELAKHKRPLIMFFNVGQYVLSLSAAWLVMVAVGIPDGLASLHRPLNGRDLLWVIATWVVWYVVNNALVSGLAADQGMTFVEGFTEDFNYYVVCSAAVLALSPLVVFAAMTSSWYIPLLLIPMFAVHKTAAISMTEQHKALHDPLTGLPNRKLLTRTVETALAKGPGSPFALAMLDLDRFKDVNDTLGHQVGDRLLELVAARISSVLRPGDVVARLGGDEFALHLPDVVDGQDGAEVALRVRAALGEPFVLDDVVLELEASVGITMFPAFGASVEELLRQADVAMYVAKEQRSEVEVYDPSRDRHSADRLGLLAALRHAIDDGELFLHYQPKVALLDSEIVGVEALVRWNHPVRGLVPPDEFIPLAETSGLMHRLTAFVIDAALAQVSQWRAEGLTVAVAVNVSAKDLHGPHLARTVSEALARHRVPAMLLKLELTERTLMAEHARVFDTLEALEALDVEISLDDFGVEYSSMVMLKRLNLSEIKIDGSFVKAIGEAESIGGDVSIVRSIIQLAHALGLNAVAEGVETEQAWRLLAGMGCDSAQGWYVSRPMAAEAATDWLRIRVPAGMSVPNGAGPARH